MGDKDRRENSGLLFQFFQHLYKIFVIFVTVIYHFFLNFQCSVISTDQIETAQLASIVWCHICQKQDAFNLSYLYNAPKFKTEAAERISFISHLYNELFQRTMTILLTSSYQLLMKCIQISTSFIEYLFSKLEYVLSNGKANGKCQGKYKDPSMWSFIGLHRAR